MNAIAAQKNNQNFEPLLLFLMPFMKLFSTKCIEKSRLITFHAMFTIGLPPTAAPIVKYLGIRRLHAKTTLLVLYVGVVIQLTAVQILRIQNVSTAVQITLITLIVRTGITAHPTYNIVTTLQKSRYCYY